MYTRSVKTRLNIIASQVKRRLESTETSELLFQRCDDVDGFLQYCQLGQRLCRASV